MTRDLILNSGNLCMGPRAKRNNQITLLPQSCSRARDSLGAKWNRTIALKSFKSYLSESLVQHLKLYIFAVQASH